MDLCVLPQTGSTEPWMLVAVVAAVLIAAGIALTASGRARRSVLTGLGALAIIGALVAGSIGGAAPAQADAGSTSCVTAPVGDEVSAATLVAPGIPTAALQCAAEPTVQIPSTQGVTYTQARTGSTLTVTAVPAAGYAFVAGATTTWTFDMTATSAAPWPVELPERTAAYPSEGTPWLGGAYLTPIDPELVPALQAAADAGEVTYALDGSGWRMEIDLVAYDPETDEELDRRTASAPIPAELSYDFERGEYLLVSEEFSFENLFAAVTAAGEELQALYPDARIEADLESEADIYDGLQIVASYEPGVGCETVTQVVPLDLVFQPMPAPRAILDGLAPALDEAIDRLESLDDAPVESPALESPSTQAPASEAPATEAPAAPSETDAAPASDEEVVDATTPVDER
ncbi:hypothetical protein [Agrococcus jejuensis]|uniref:LPXTG-motif cell wall anchor domain-containing protein n=1 Tax=Agrococcus jejuensis TaxID=399736 RepID=A0A1G8CS40_9MICO|nr:hypothetical protein [Agrococcus jejuensis]SDH48357.1 hypothetical protein SAMN04489720_1394 [Agrococcus jejuensis]